ncbi:MAG: hypothetical protein LBN04_02995 [Oscillospiraceae bacterium]|jgi:hypothetical protein|nr:hypothetical protein [Oscillospiraceae bacterium]
MSMERLLAQIPDYQAFLTVDEINAELRKLAEDYPKTVQVFEAGVSRAGSPILCARIGDGQRKALFYGCPHPNEPIGAMMSLYFARAIAADDAYRRALGFTFLIIPVADVDGTRLNEGWFKGPFTLYEYARHFFRPASADQVEWSFPMDYKTYRFTDTMPETRALMRIIDEEKPCFLYSLHNAGFGGAYWYLSHPQPEGLFKALHARAEAGGVPLDLGEPEMPYIERLYPAVYRMPCARDQYDFLEKNVPGDPAAYMEGGECSGAYAGADVQELVCELPYFFEPRVQSNRLLDFPRAEAIRQKLALEEAHYEALREAFAPVDQKLSPDNPFAKMLRQTLRFLPIAIQSERAFIENNPAFDAPCRESEAFSAIEMTRFYQLLNWGLLARCGEATNAAAILEAEAEALEKALSYQVIPIRNLVAVQLASGLTLLEQMNRA